MQLSTQVGSQVEMKVHFAANFTMGSKTLRRTIVSARVLLLSEMKNEYNSYVPKSKYKIIIMPATHKHNDNSLLDANSYHKKLHYRTTRMIRKNGFYTFLVGRKDLFDPFTGIDILNVL
jgi:hypothetical protein